MKFSMFLCCGLIAAGSASPSLVLGEGTGFSPMVQSQRPGPGREREAEKSAPQRDPRAPSEADRSRMSPDERRQLRRDIQDAGKEIYRPAQQGRGDGRYPGRR
ncbi:MAG: hypothetical protein NT123_19390 [Proteobacteria bacterium]|nr:hypothetical protein [Pseudomonadota bacterium]